MELSGWGAVKRPAQLTADLQNARESSVAQ